MRFFSKDNRAFSFILMLLIYILAFAAGLFCFKYLTVNSFNNLYLNLFLADLIATLVVFIFSLILKNASSYDPYWSVQGPVILIGLTYLYKPDFSICILLLVICLWGLRLTSNWAYTFKNFNCQDWRYTMLKQKSGIFYPFINFIGIHYIPTCIVYLCTLPAIYAVKNGITLQPVSYVFIILSFLSIVLQTTADLQMHLFKLSGKTGFIRTGVWKHGRHPNYLAEILMWWGVALSVFAVCNEWVLLSGALSNTLLFLLVSVPMADNRQRQKTGFEEYKKETRIFI